MNVLKKVLKKFIKVKKEKVLIPYLQGELLKGRKALITGGTSGIGFQIAKSFLLNGAKVIITGRNVQKLKESKQKLISETNCNIDDILIHELDISNIEELESEFKKITNEIDFNIDIFVNNAGVNGGKCFPNTTIEEYDYIMNTNLRGTYFVSQEFVNYMISNNIKGNILNVLSSSSLRPGNSPYILSKWGLRSLTMGMAKKYLKSGIIINGIAPSSTSTPMINKNDVENLNSECNEFGRFIAPEEVANFATILVSDIGKMVVGDVIYMTAGAGILTYDDMTY